MLSAGAAGSYFEGPVAITEYVFETGNKRGKSNQSTSQRQDHHRIGLGHVVWFEDQRALLSEAATLRSALFRRLSESPRDIYNQPRLEDFDLANWNGVLASLGPDHFIHAALEQRRVATAAARADSDEQRALWDSD